MSEQLIQFIRALLFGISAGIASFYFFLYFKPIVEEIIGGNSIPVDLWWWFGIVFSIVLGIFLFLILL